MDLSTQDLAQLEKSLTTRFGFNKQEINFVMRHKPTFLFWEKDLSKGIAMLEALFVKKYGFDIELVRTLVVKYPFILSKSQEHLEGVFAALQENGVSHAEAIKLIFECPKLVSVNLQDQIKETMTLFNLYHKISAEQVMDVFRFFPYLFCCDTLKMKLFMSQFRKYRFSQKQILHLVSPCNQY